MDLRLHNDCDGGFCWACRQDELAAKGRVCKSCFWWLSDGTCRRWRPSYIQRTEPEHSCDEHSFGQPVWLGSPPSFTSTEKDQTND